MSSFGGAVINKTFFNIFLVIVSFALVTCAQKKFDVGEGKDQSDSGSKDSLTGNDDDLGGLDENSEKRLDAEPVIPKPTGPCPELANGINDFSVGGKTVKVLVSMNDAIVHENKNGQFIFYWHGTNSSPLEIATTLGTAVQKFLDDGAVIVLPQSPTGLGGTGISGTPVWYTNDLLLADEMIGCAVTQGIVDPKKIHVTGLSAGGLMTTSMSYMRSNYVASVASISGGIIIAPPQYENEKNKFAAMAIYGGPQDIVGVRFEDAQNKYFDELTINSHYAILCNHEKGHIPSGGFLGDPIYNFFKVHSYGEAPWKGRSLPDMPPYCKSN